MNTLIKFDESKELLQQSHFVKKDYLLVKFAQRVGDDWEKSARSFKQLLLKYNCGLSLDLSSAVTGVKLEDINQVLKMAMAGLVYGIK